MKLLHFIVLLKRLYRHVAKQGIECAKKTTTEFIRIIFLLLAINVAVMHVKFQFLTLKNAIVKCEKIYNLNLFYNFSSYHHGATYKIPT